MKKFKLVLFSFLILMGSRSWATRQRNELEKNYPVLSSFYPVPNNENQYFKDVYFRLGWKPIKPYQIAVQFTNQSYETVHLKFALKDVTAQKMVILDKAKNTVMGTETLGSISEGALWSAPIDEKKDHFILRIWDKDGNETRSSEIVFPEKK